MSRPLLSLLCALALLCVHCSSSKQAPAGLEAGARDAASEGLTFRDTGPLDAAPETLPSPLDAGDANEDGSLVPPPDIFTAEKTLQKPDKGSLANCLGAWTAWICKGNALTGCNASCGTLTINCSALGICTCSLSAGGAKQKCAPIPPLPPPLPGCGFCQSVLQAGCCGPTP